MTDQPTPINRPLTDDERFLLADLTVWCIAEQKGVTDDQARDALAELSAKGGLSTTGDAINAYVRYTNSGKVIVHVTREWLAYWAHTDEQLTSDELRRVVRYDIPEPNETLAMDWPWRCVRCHRGSDTLDEHKVCPQCAAKEKP